MGMSIFPFNNLRPEPGRPEPPRPREPNEILAELEKMPGRTMLEVVSRVIAKIEHLQCVQSMYQERRRYNHRTPFYDVAVRPVVNSIEADLLPIANAVEAHWPYPPLHGPEWRESLAAIKHDSPGATADVIQGFQLVRQRLEIGTELPVTPAVPDTGTPPLSNASVWDVFISHASEDKATLVRPLARALQEKGMRVWLDELVLTVGMSLRRSIEDGLSHSRYVVVVVSPAFLKKEWPQKELDGGFAKETDGRDVVLPVWHNVDAKTVQQNFPILAGIWATSTDKGVDAVAADLMKAMQC